MHSRSRHSLCGKDFRGFLTFGLETFRFLRGISSYFNERFRTRKPLAIGNDLCIHEQNNDVRIQLPTGSHISMGIIMETAYCMEIP